MRPVERLAFFIGQRAVHGAEICDDGSMSKKDKDLVTGGNQARQRDSKGRFIKGVSGNPRGRPKTDEEIKEALRELVPKSIEVLKEIIENRGARDQDRIRAIELIFDRVYGRPFQQMQVEDTTVDKTLVMKLEGFEQYGV